MSFSPFYKKIIQIAIISNFILLCNFPLKADLFYFPSEFNDLYNEKVALEVELKSLKRQLINERHNLESKIIELQNDIDNLNMKIDNIIKGREADKKQFENKIRELENVRDILKAKSSNQAKKLINENKNIQKRCEERINHLNQKLQKEKEDHLNVLAKINNDYTNKIFDLESRINDLNEELANIKKLTESQLTELDRLKAQTEDLEKNLANEIASGEIRLKKLHEKLIINIDDKISFNSGKAELKEEILGALSKIASIISNYKENTIVIEGHTDNIPIKTKYFRDNWQLSTERALAVLNYILKNKQLDSRRFSASGYGEYHPIVSNDTAENRALNRRVDIVVIPRLHNQ